MGPEVLKLAGPDLFIHYGDGMASTKLTPVLIDKTLGMPGTARNLNTIRKVMELADADG